ncbi:uncharacterized protein LOC132040395 [Lycium ferocissimum]|uniref:uncharacterized protein LOC132040395 n=1 Tax=Lycium ferocissimum TaxID=112874 RepID=UPI002816924E|nr:uncharacterized protein LOC132040395 [Lycium ferocissimum]
MVFKDVDEFRRAVTRYAVQRRVQVDKWVNEPKRVRVLCRNGCPWLLYAKLDNTTHDFQIKTYNPKHTCYKSTRNYLCNAKFIAEVYRKKITEQPNIRVFKLQELIRKKFNVHVGKTTVRRARAKFLKEIMGDHIVEFGRILDYKDELLRTNPGSTCVVKLGEPDAAGQPVFQSFYMCFDALKKAFLACRKCIGLDGCFLKGVCKGQLLVAVCRDGNNQMLPLAWAVVEYENKHTWTWFIKCLREDFALGDGADLTLITDMQKGLFVAIQDLLPAAEHRKCARHILANFCKDWRGLQRRQQFWKIAKSTHESQLRKNIAKMKKLGPEEMMDKLMYFNIEYWCKVYFNTEVKVDSVDNNMSECFNSWILAARHKTIITMLEEIRVKMMTRIGSLREFVNTWRSNYSPMSIKVLEENIVRSMECNIDFNGVAGFEVREGLLVHTVDLGRRYCSCRAWQLKGIPCAHALAAISHKQYDPLDYMHSCYNKETYMRTYATVLEPLTNMEMWPISSNPTVAPLEYKTMPGRPAKVRRKEAHEIRKSGNCLEMGWQ